MKNAILIHGLQRSELYHDPAMPSPSNDHWLPWVQKQLLINSIHTETPEMPTAWRPVYEEWQQALERYDITPETTLIGHSAGGGFIVRWLSENPDRQVGKVILVVPSLGTGWDETGFFDFKIDRTLRKRAKSITIFGSNNDKPAVMSDTAHISSEIEGAEYIELQGFGHFDVKSMGTREFPALVDRILD